MPSTLGTPDQLRDPDHLPPLPQAAALGIQHVLAMFAANIAVAVIVASAAGLGPGSAREADGLPEMTYLIQVSMLFAGVATLLQSLGAGKVGARLPIVHGTSFAFIPIMVPLVAGKGVEGMAMLTGGVLAGGLLHVALGAVILRIRFAFPPLVTGTVVLMIGLTLLPVGIQYAAGGAALAGTQAFGGWQSWSMALLVIAVTLVLGFATRGIWSLASVLIGLIAGWLYALALGQVSLSPVAQAGWLAAPVPLRFGIEFHAAAVIGFCLMAMVSAVETLGDVSGVTKGGADRLPSGREIAGVTYGNGFATLIAGAFGGLPSTSFSQNVGLIAMTGVMSRYVTALGALFLILCGLIPKAGAVVASLPIEVLGGAVIVMFGMVCAAGIRLLKDIGWTRRNMTILGLSLSAGLGLYQEPQALQHLPELPRLLLATGLVPAAVIAITLNLALPGREREAMNEKA